MMASIHWRCRARLPKRGGWFFAVGPDQVHLEVMGDQGFEVASGESFVTEDDLRQESHRRRGTPHPRHHWHLLSDPATHYTDLAATSTPNRIDSERRKRTHVHQLEALGYKVTLQPAA